MVGPRATSDTIVAILIATKLVAALILPTMAVTPGDGMY
jgi:hypothetical protein